MPLVDESNGDYHASDAVSRSGLWTIYTKSPFHYAFTKNKPSPVLDIGTATHTAILEPERFEETIMRGPEDRRGNKWREMADEAVARDMILLTEGDYTKVEIMREVAASNAYLQALLRGDKLIEQSAYITDEEHGVQVKSRPDLFNKSLSVLVDLKTAVSAAPDDFSRAIAKRGYHMQEAVYTDVFGKASGLNVDGFVFVVIEKPTENNPPVIECYELDANAVSEGYAQYRKALARYAECVKNNAWPSYSGTCQTLSLRPWDYIETQPIGDG